MMRNVPNTGYTHAGKFHADDVFSTALLKIMNPNYQYYRGFKPDGLSDITYDIGGGEFDHHDEPRECRENGAPYAAFGKIWRCFGPSLVGEKNAARFDLEFVQPLDIHDNTGRPDTLSSAIGAFNPRWDSGSDGNEEFAEAVRFAMVILHKQFARILANSRAEAELASGEHLASGTILVCNRYVPSSSLAETPVVLTIMPSQRGGWNAMAVKDSIGTDKILFPESWRGKRDDAASSEADGLTFCHASGFLAAFKTKECAINACVRIVSNATPGL